MNADQWLDYYEQIADAPGAISRLRQFVMDLAVRGRLVEQDPNDEPVSELLDQIKTEQNQRVNNGKIRKAKPSPPIEEPPFDLPDSWTWLPLGQTGNIFTGNSINAITRERLSKTEEGYPFIATKDVGYGYDSINYDNGLLVSAEDRGFKVACKQSVLICAEGGSAGRKIGITDRNICFGNKLLANETWSVISPRFVMFVYLSSFFYEQFAKRMTGIIGGISINRFLQLPFPLPPLAEQYRIVEKVDELMLLCDWLKSKQVEREVIRVRFAEMSLARLNVSNTNPTVFQNHVTFVIDNLVPLTTHPRQIKLLRQTILNLAMYGKLVEQDPNDEPASELLKRIELEKKRLVEGGEIKKNKAKSVKMVKTDQDLPTSWKWVALSTIFLYDAGIKQEPKALSPNMWLLELEDIEKDTGRLLTRVRASERKSKSTKSEFRVGDILYGKLRPYLNKTLVADEPGYSTTEIVALRSYLPQCSEYCALALRRSDFVNYVAKLGQGTKMPRLRTKDALAAPFPLPPLAEQYRIATKVNELMALCDQLEVSLCTCKDTRRQLLDIMLDKSLKSAASQDRVA